MNFTSKMHSKKLKVAIGEMIPKHLQYVYGSGEIATSECRKVSKNQVTCARCHFVGLASGMDCTT